jgi:long-chain acyl-CoA synthetase
MELLHFARLVPEYASQWGNKTVLKYRDQTDETWKSISWEVFDRDVLRAAKSIADRNVLEKDRVGIFSNNRPESLVVEYALYANRAIAVPLFASSTTQQIEYIINDSDISLLFVGDQYQYDRAFEAMSLCKGLQLIVVFNPDVRLAVTDVTSLYFKEFLQAGLLAKTLPIVEERRQNAQDEDVANILYTSGTTGEPKGVILTHEMFLETIRVHDLKLKALGQEEVSMCFLPLSHVFEKAWTHFCLHRGFTVCIHSNPAEIRTVLKEVQPTCMCSVPRFWEKVYEGIQDRINALPRLVRTVFDQGVRVGRSYQLEYVRKGKKVPLLLHWRYLLYKATLFRFIQKEVGLSRARVLPVAGAKLSNDLCLFFRSIGFPIYYGYGMTETTATVSAFDDVHYRIGTVGTLIDGIEVRIGEGGEIQVKGKTVTKGYYRKPEATREAFTPDGFFRTGDGGSLDGRTLIMSDRIKDLYKTSHGKYIAPQVIETALCEDRYIDMAAVIGNDKKYVTALIVPALDRIPLLCAELGISYTSLEEVLMDERMYTFFEQRIHKVQKHMAGYEQIRRFTLLSEPFTVDSGDLTDTLKIRRRRVAQHYADRIDSMY